MKTKFTDLLEAKGLTDSEKDLERLMDLEERSPETANAFLKIILSEDDMVTLLKEYILEEANTTPHMKILGA